ncbi:hypothetical protein BH20ACI1_BH20ACI1_16480 [soil metagenome]
MQTFFIYIILFFLLFTITTAQTKTEPLKSKDLAEKAVRNSAINLVSEIGNEASKLSNVSDKILIKIEVAKVLVTINKENAINFLESAWQDVSSISKEEPENKNLLPAKNKIIALASEIAPEKAEKWRKILESGEQKSGETDKKNETDKPPQTAREKADILVKAAIAKVENNPQIAVSESLSSLYNTKKISGHFLDLFQKLSADKQYSFLEDLKKGLAEYATAHLSSDINDLGAISSLLSSNLISDLETQHQFGYFLSNSAKLVLNPQIMAGKRPGEVLQVYEYFQIFLRPVILRFSPEYVLTLDGLLKDISAFVPANQLDNPLLSSEAVEAQIEEAKKTVGFEERDRRLTKIVLWLLSKKTRSSKNNVVNLAQSATDEITNLATKEKLNDFIKIVEVEKLIADEDFPSAEKKADKISQIEWRAWALMVLGNHQKSNQFTANELYDKSSAVLQKAAGSFYKSQLMFELASLQFKSNQSSAFNTLSEAVKFLNQAKEEDLKKKQLNFFIVIDELGLDANDLYQMKTTDIQFNPALGKFASSNWNQTLFISQNIEPLLQRLQFQLLIAQTVLNKYSKFNAVPKK